MLQVTFGINLFLIIPQYGYLWTTFLPLQSKLCICSWVGLKLFFPGKMHLGTNISHLKDNTSYFCSFSHLLLFWWRMFMMWLFMIALMFCIQLLLGLTLSLLNISLKVWLFGKWISIRYNNDWPILVVTPSLHARLNHKTFHWRLLFLFSWLLALGAW